MFEIIQSQAQKGKEYLNFRKGFFINFISQTELYPCIPLRNQILVCRFKRSAPSCTVVATSLPSRVYNCPIHNARPLLAIFEEISYNNL